MSDDLDAEVAVTRRKLAEAIGREERLALQLASCGAVAAGNTTPPHLLKPGDVGHSAAYEAALRVRLRYDETMILVVRLADCWPNCACKGASSACVHQTAHEMRERFK